MSTAVLPERGTKSASLRERALARIAVVIAFALLKATPRTVMSVLSFVVRGGARPGMDEVQRCRQLIVGVSLTCAGEGCLPRSVATAVLSRMLGYGVSWRTGVRDRPFTAHAWVEIDGVPVGETTSVASLSVLLAVDPEYAMHEMERKPARRRHSRSRKSRRHPSPRFITRIGGRLPHPKE